jgi:NADH-quinone oxidoreductase subunit M
VNGFPILSVMTFLPLVGALVIFFTPRASAALPRMVALVASLLSLLLSILMLLRFDRNAPFQAGQPVPFQEKLDWLPGVGVSYFLGVDAISVLLIVLTTLLSTIAVIWSWDTIAKRQREYFLALLLLETGMIGVFVALDLFVFYIFWELMLIPMALLIGIWGSTNRVYSAVKFFLYTLFGSLLMLVGIIATYQAYFNQTGTRTLNVLELAQGTYDRTFQFWVFAAFFIAFAVKVPLFPFHTWLPDAHTEAPTAASVILAAVMLKMGGYGMLRFNLPLFPEATRIWAPWIILLSVIAILYGALVALPQPDMKRLIAYSSVSHMGFVTLGIFILNQHGLNGAMVVMLAHGFNTGALFLLVGVIYERAHTRQISAFGGLGGKMPVWTALFGLFMFASIGLPGLSGFVGEFLVALGTWQYNPWAALFTFAVVIFAAWYMMWLFQRLAFGRAKGELPDPHDAALTAEERAMLAAAGGHGHAPMPVSGGSHAHAGQAGAEPSEAHEPYAAMQAQEHVRPWPDITLKEGLTLFPLAVLTIVVGVYPGPVLNLIQPAVDRILAPFM